MFCRNTFVGRDSAGNRYYKKGAKRFVVYASKDCDPATISTSWYLWLHGASDVLPVVDQHEVLNQSKITEELEEKKSFIDTYVPWRPQ